MSLVKRNGFREFDKALAHLGLFGRDLETPLPATTWSPSVHIFENDNEVVVKAELPGMTAKNIDLRLENNTLNLKGERPLERETKEENDHRIEGQYGAFARSFALSTAVNGDKVTAEYKARILKVVLPKQEERKLKPIHVAVAQNTR